jgi:electron transport complex protein RnfG
MKKDFVMPILVLTLICLVVSGALAVVNDITHPVIQEASIQRAFEAKREMLPDAEDFILLEAEGLPYAVTEVYATPNSVGYIVAVTAQRGYGGDFYILCGINPNGEIIKSKVLSHTETMGLGTKVFDAAVVYEGMNKAQAAQVDTIAGSTITSRAYREAMKDALEAFDIIKGADNP